MLRIIDQLKTELNDKINDKSELQENHDTLHNTISELQAKIANYEKLTQEAETVLQWVPITKKIAEPVAV